MPIDPNSPIEITAFEWVPPFARGQVRDLRVRWALEEAGLSYRTRLISARERPEWYFKEQPFGQVPYYKDGETEMFECAAIALHIAEKSEKLLPRSEPRRGQTLTWLLAAMNSIDLQVMSLIVIEVFAKGEQWAELRKPAQLEILERRLNQLAGALGDKEFLVGDFTVADILMIGTLRTAMNSSVAMPQALKDYIKRGEARPAFQAALAAQLADFLPDPEGVPA